MPGFAVLLKRVLPQKPRSAPAEAGLDAFESWLTQWGVVWGLPRLTSRIEVVVGRRLRTSLGRCHPASGKIQLHPALLTEGEPILREVLCHEAAHAAAFLLHGRRVRPHGAEWRELMRLAGFAPRARIDTRALSAEFRKALSPRVLYRHRCRSCKTERMARRAVRAWRCRKCWDAGDGGRLEISRIPQEASDGTHQAEFS